MRRCLKIICRFFSHKSGLSTENMDEIEVLAIVPPAEPRPVEVCPVKGGCPICCFDFEDGERVVVMGCQGRHIMHSGCYDAMVKEDKRHQGETYPHTVLEAVRRHEGASNCPVCRQMSHCSTKAIAMIFYSGKTLDDAIPVNDVDSYVMDVEPWANPEDYDSFFDADDDEDWVPGVHD
jgi:hypothetical protein